jgi:ABC-2 type transport system permease protein
MTGTWQLIRLALRRDRFLLPVWVVLIPLFVIGVASSFAGLYADDAEREAFAASMSAPSLTAVYGPLFGSSLGALTAWRAGLMLVIAALIAGMVVIRHTRAEEEQGRRELLGATVLGRQAGLAAALAVVCGASAVLGVILTLGMLATVPSPAGALAIGLQYTLACCLFATVAAVAAQLTQSARTARWILGAVLAGSMVLRIVGDANGNLDAPLSWASPLGLLQRIRPYAGERWWVAVLVLVVTVVLVAAAYALNARRDLDAGLVGTRPGPARASRLLASPLGLAWRLQRGNILAWVVGVALLGLVFGGAADAASTAFDENEQLADLFRRMGGGASISDLFLATVFSILGVIAAAQGVQIALRARAEESAGHAESVLATAVGRVRWGGGHVLLALLGPALTLLAGGLSAGLSYGSASGDVGAQLPRMLASALVPLPAVWLTVGIAVALFGLVPRFSGAAWGAVVLFLLLGQLGAILQLNQWVLDLSPFSHIPSLPGGEFTATPLVWLLAIAAALIGAGLAAFRRRDLAT